MAKRSKASRYFACRGCFRDERLRGWIADQPDLQAGTCAWCGAQSVHLVPLEELGPHFRAVATSYTENMGEIEFFAGHGEPIGDLIQEDWGTFSDAIEEMSSVNSLCVAILKAGLHPKDDVDEPDYDGIFLREDPMGRSIDEDWNERVSGLLTHPPAPPTPQEIAETPELADAEIGMPDRLEYIIEEMGREFDVGEALFRARVHRDRERTARFTPPELAAPPVEHAKAGRANRDNEAVLYVASDEATAVSEVRPWKGAPVAVARIVLTKKVKVLDLTDLEALESPFFEEDIRWKVEARGLLWQLREDLKRPVTPHLSDRQYLPTQYEAELARNAGFDGIAFASAMGPGRNIIIFDPEAGAVTDLWYVRVDDVVYTFAREESETIEVDEFPYE